VSNPLDLLKNIDRKRPDIKALVPKKSAALYLCTPDVPSIQMEIAKIKPNPDQPRKNFDPDKLNILANTIKNHGVIQPVVVRRDAGSGDIILVAGERRLRATVIAGFDTIPVVFIDPDKSADELSLIENLQRENLNAVEKAEGMLRVQNKRSCTQDELGALLGGMTKSSVSESLSLTRLPDEIKDVVRQASADQYPARLLIAIARCGSPEEMIALFNQYRSEQLSSDDIIKLSRSKKTKKIIPLFAPKVINKQIGKTEKYLLGRINTDNIGEVRESLISLRDLLNKLLGG